jgi:hypothetical protein
MAGMSCSRIGWTSACACSWVRVGSLRQLGQGKANNSDVKTDTALGAERAQDGWSDYFAAER